MAIADILRATTAELRVVCGTFEGGGSSATTKIAGDGWTVATGAGNGVYTVTLTGMKGSSLVGFVANVNADAPNNVDTYSCHLDWNASSTSSLVMTTSEGGTPTDIAADEYVSFIAIFKE